MQQRPFVVTGAAGLVGTQVVQKLLTLGNTVQAVVRREPPTAHPVMIPARGSTSNLTFHITDLSTVEPDWMWMEDIQPAAVIHCAAMTDVDACERDPKSAYTINEYATRSLAEACVRYGTHLLLVSTDYVFDGSDEHPGPYNEDDVVRPLNHYGRSKWFAEIAVQDICGGKTAWSICRSAVVYSFTPGTRDNFATWLLRKLRNGECVRIVNDQISSPTLADDLADMLIEIVRKQALGIFHTAGSTVIDRYRFALALANLFALDSSLIRPIATSELQQAARRPLKGGLCIDKIRRELGIMPLSLEQSLLRLKGL